MSETVFVLIGAQNGVDYEDPGVREFVSVHKTQLGAERAKKAALAAGKPGWIDEYEIEEVELQP